MILVTGASGFMGRHIVAALHARGKAVRALDILPWPECPVPLIRGDITDNQVLQRAVQGVRAVIHLAAISNLWTRNRCDHDTVNAYPTGRLAAWARAVGAERFVYISSYATLLSADTPDPVTEAQDPPLDALAGSYPRAKRGGEALAARERAANFQVTTLLPAMPLGPGDISMTAPTRLVRDLAARRLPALLETRLNMIDVRDLAQAVITALDHPQPAHRYILGGHEVMLSQFAALIDPERQLPRVPYPLAYFTAMIEEGLVARLTGRPPAAPLTGVKLAHWARPLSSALAQRELGLHVRPLDETLADTLGWLRATGALPS